MGAIKHDQEKPRTDLLPPYAIEAVARVLSFGATKYGEHNWRKGMEWTRLAGAVLRHVFAWLRGEDIDPESGLPHLAHAATTLLFLLEYAATATGVDNRYVKKDIKYPSFSKEDREMIEFWKRNNL